MSVTTEAAAFVADFAFAPNPGRAARLDAAVRAGLADSLTAVFSALGLPPDARQRRFLKRVEAGPVPPGVFAVYVELVLAVMRDEDDAARALAHALFGVPTAAAGLSVVTLDDGGLGNGQAERYRRLLAEDIGAPIDALAAAALADACAKLDAALALLGAGAPDVAAELRVLIRQIVLVRASGAGEGTTFGGASSFALWGALVLNAERLADPLEAAVQLAHETAHTLLFGLAQGGQLTDNAAEARYASPLRIDPRPMEGVAHAVFVTGRMIYTLDRLLAGGVLDIAAAARAREQLVRNEAAYAAGLATVMKHATLTPAGEAAFRAVRRHMDRRAR
ncbi:MAG TPA: HEXXH motif-containing putative peptide modification protein [Caulobacteraceae bacterium]|nr:HEXXH motif-containing putative peptide modification protein [Caulobacteraceae bacterium]